MNTDQLIVSKRLHDLNDPLLGLVENTYNSSFPVEERRDFSLIRSFVCGKPYFEMHAFLQGNQYVGFITSWKLDGFVYVEHFAIDESYRNGGIGASVMKNFLENQNMPVVLEVELPNDSLSKRRIGFYQRLGYMLDDHVYYQPKYHPEDDLLELRLMTFGSLDLNESFEHVKNEILNKAYLVK